MSCRKLSWSAWVENEMKLCSQLCTTQTAKKTWMHSIADSYSNKLWKMHFHYIGKAWRLIFRLAGQRTFAIECSKYFTVSGDDGGDVVNFNATMQMHSCRKTESQTQYFQHFYAWQVNFNLCSGPAEFEKFFNWNCNAISALSTPRRKRLINYEHKNPSDSIDVRLLLRQSANVQHCCSEIEIKCST